MVDGNDIPVGMWRKGVKVTPLLEALLGGLTHNWCRPASR